MWGSRGAAAPCGPSSSSLWTGTHTRGPADPPCSSKPPPTPSARRRSWARACRGSTGVSSSSTSSSPLGAAAPLQRFACPSASSSLMRRKMAGSTASASLGLGDGVAASDLGEAQAAPSSARRVTISYEEANADDIFVPAPPGRTLKINVDLLLWRCRQARLKAQLCLDGEQRRELMKEAEAGLRRCLALDPADPRTYVVLGKTLMVQRRFDEARALYAEGVTNTGNSNPYIWSAWGWLEFKTGNVARARQLFDAAIVVDGTHACAWHKWGLLEKSEGNYLKARDLWMQGIRRCKRKPQSQNAYLFNALAVMAAELQRVSEARAWFDEGTSTTEGAASVALWQAWAVLEARQGDPTAVRYLFKKALGANPKSRYVHLAWALWERQSGNMLACLELLQRGVAHNPTDAALYQARALVEWRDFSRPERARQVFEEGLLADPGHLPLWQAWGCMEAQLGNVERARELFQQGVWADPRSRDTVWVFHAWGCLERGQGNLQLARELFKAAIKVEPKADKVWFTWIAMETDGGFAERADELRIRQAEQQWEFEVPAGFTTRPGGLGSAPTAAAAAAASGGAAQAGGAAAAAAAAAGEVVAAALSPLASLRDTLAQFFKARAGKAPGGAGQQQPSWGPAQPFLPADFRGDLSVEDALRGELPQGPAGAAARTGPNRQGASAAAAVDQAASLLLTPAGDAPSSAAAGPAPLQPSLVLQGAAQGAQPAQQQPDGSDGASALVFSASLGAEDDGEHDVQGRALAVATGSTTSAAARGAASKKRAAQPGPRGPDRGGSGSPAPPAHAAGARRNAQAQTAAPAERRRAAGYREGSARPAPRAGGGSGGSPALAAKPVRPAAAPDASAPAPEQQQQQDLPGPEPQLAEEPAGSAAPGHAAVAAQQATAPALATAAARGG